MSEHTYTPNSKFGKWFNDRLPLLTLGDHLANYPTPKNLNYWWTFGGILTFCLVTHNCYRVGSSNALCSPCRFSI